MIFPGFILDGDEIVLRPAEGFPSRPDAKAFLDRQEDLHTFLRWCPIGQDADVAQWRRAQDLVIGALVEHGPSGERHQRAIAVAVCAQAHELDLLRADRDAGG